ncbi:P2Y purinoceptor 13-like [Engraulis encrasicolus]|uniref:P2Y purinoceptor 13-like n=1 Tax=Engraulis encrasicolus TaxID=184585 RepID=UPI002FCFC6E2
MASSPAQLDCGIHLDVSRLVIMGLYFVLFIPALLLNIMAAWISWKLKNKSSFIVYLKNLVAADLLMTLIFPLRAAEELPGSPWGLRVFNCQFGSVLFYLCMYVSIVLMGVISLDRFFKIVQPGGKLFGQSALVGMGVSAVVWIAILSTSTIPTMVLTSEQPKHNLTSPAELCMAMKSDLGKLYHTAVILLCNVIFFIILVVIFCCYVCIAKKVVKSYRNSRSTNARRKWRVKAHVFIVLLVFLVCFAPYHITRFLYSPKQVENEINCPWASLRVAKDITLWLATTNVCLDPLIYFLLCKAFREKLYELKIFGDRFSLTKQQTEEVTSN